MKPPLPQASEQLATAMLAFLPSSEGIALGTLVEAFEKALDSKAMPTAFVIPSFPHSSVS